MLKRTSVASVRFKALFPILAALLLAALVLYASVIEPSRLQVKSVSYSSSRLPAAFDGFRVVQLSDLHLGSFVKHPHTISRLVQKVNALHPQLILFTGDLVNRQSAELQPFTAQLSQLKATYGVYAVLGNHDYGSYYRWPTPEAERANLEQLKQMVSDMGWRWLHNAHTFIHHRGDSIALLGVENEGEPPFPQNGDLPAALRGAGNGFKLLMSHNPTHWRREVLPQSDVDLTPYPCHAERALWSLPLSAQLSRVERLLLRRPAGPLCQHRHRLRRLPLPLQCGARDYPDDSKIC